MVDRPFRTKNHYVEEAIREAIDRGDLRPGNWVRPEEWASRLGTSLTPVREALRKLDAEGLIRIFPHRGARVVGLSRKEFDEVYQLRSVLEGLAAFRAVTVLDDDETARLLEHLESVQVLIRDAIDRGDMVGLRAANKDFHLAIYECADSPRLFRLIENLWVTFPWDTLSLVPGRPSRTVSEHDAIIDAIRAHDADAVRVAVSSHIDLSASALMAAEGQLGLRVFEEEDARTP